MSTAFAPLSNGDSLRPIERLDRLGEPVAQRPRGPVAEQLGGSRDIGERVAHVAGPRGSVVRLDVAGADELADRLE